MSRDKKRFPFPTIDWLGLSQSKQILDYKIKQRTKTKDAEMEKMFAHNAKWENMRIQ